MTVTDDMWVEIRDQVKAAREEGQDTRERVIKLEVGVGILRWLFGFLLALITVVASVASIIVGWIQAGG